MKSLGGFSQKLYFDFWLKPVAFVINDCPQAKPVAIHLRQLSFQNELFGFHLIDQRFLFLLCLVHRIRCGLQIIRRIQILQALPGLSLLPGNIHYSTAESFFEQCWQTQFFFIYS